MAQASVCGLVPHNSLAHLLATCPEAKIRNGDKALEEAKKAMTDGGEGNVGRIRTATENVERALHKMAETLYKTAQSAQPAEAANAAGAGAGPASTASAPGGAGKPGDVIDAEYVDVDEKKAPN